ncbi:MAG TPA: bifunctional glycoside hydrolase 114/ polysaccharide deacetylase family protein [Burkholderiales bacterium]|nr:bifunctional glycoside hydrolase 114/ polysaccharide deacetylase family protein [Burkholderiales bacterium]
MAFFYGANPPWDELRAFDIVVVEPAHLRDLQPPSLPGTQVFAYVAVGEVEYDRPYAKELPQGLARGSNEAWRSHVIDQTHPEWPRFFLDRVVAPLWKAGYRGFFLDTLDSFHLIAKTDEERARQVQGLIGVIRGLRLEYPEAKLIFNRGFEILPELKGEAVAVAVESIYRGWNQRNRSYVEVSEADRKWLMGQLDRVRNEYKLPVIAIDYVPPRDRAAARETARRISELGFIPWVANPDLDQVGVGAIEVVPRKVLMVYDGGGNEFNLYNDRVHRAATTPLNYLGYSAEYVDVTNGLPAHPLVGRYAGIVVWLPNDQSGRKAEFAEWLLRQREQGMRIAIFGNFGVPYADSMVRALGLTTGAPAGPVKQVAVAFADPIMGFETKPLPERDGFAPLRLTDGKPLLRIRADNGDTMDAAGLTSWGGYVLGPYELPALPGVEAERWVINPIEFLRRALALQPMPVPDVTTENARRLMLVHVDGDGFVSRAEMQGTPFSGEVVLREFIERYRIPQTVSVIQGEIGPTGLYPQDSPQLEAIARRIFALPHVEIGSHTYSHPLRWDVAAPAAAPVPGTGATGQPAPPQPGPGQPAAPPQGATPLTGIYGLNIPGYKFNLDAEIGGSIEYINSRLAPPGKRTRLVQWTGDTNPGRDALEHAYRAGVLNLNGGGAFATRRNPTLSQVWPVGVQKGAYFQVHAPDHNENVYTNLWTGPFYGYERAIETFELTEKPYRLKPINIYYHFYSGSKRASIAALHRVYQWALRQPVMNVYASEYAQKALDFHRTVVARSDEGWIVRTGESLRQLRAPASLGLPDFQASPGVAGVASHGAENYIHLADGRAVLRFTQQAPSQPYLVEANGRVERMQRTGRSAELALRGHMPLRFSLANVAGCRVEGDGRPLSGATQGSVTRYELKQNAIERLSITCAAG